LATYRREYVVVRVDPEPVAKVAEVVAVPLYPYDVGWIYGLAMVDPVPPAAVARIPN
jgi:hypothetical protein